MDIQTLKLDLVKKIINTEKPVLLIKINNLLLNEKSEDWWDKLPRDVQKSIMDGLDDVEKGNLFTHEQVVEEAKQKYGF
jgi:TRAP-type C4-dicarboxylate transport system substrate-binding protein